MERNGILHYQSINQQKIEELNEALKKSASGRKYSFVATKKASKDIVAEKQKLQTCLITKERWPGGMLTNL
jgi:ribosomal protein S2